MTVTLTYKNQAYDDCASTSSYGVEIVVVALEAAGYINCVAGDKGKIVCKLVGGVCDTNYGPLVDYNNTTRTWEVQTSTIIPDNTPLCIDTDGIGAPDGTGYGLTDPSVASAAHGISSDGDVITLVATTADVSRVEYVYRALDFTNFSTTTFPYLTVRFKTSAASTGMEAYITVVYTDVQSTHELGYSTDWKVSTVSLTANKTVNYIYVWTREDAAANANDTYYVYYDWYLFHAGTFTFPHVAPGGIQFHLPREDVQIPIVDRNGDWIFPQGTGSFEITVRGDILEGETWRSASTNPHFDYFLKSIIRDDWNYFSCTRPLLRCQVVFSDLWFETAGETMKLQYVLKFTGYKLLDYDDGTDCGYVWSTA